MAGKRFGPYELEGLLGRGGMGEVHRAVDTRKSRPVALKLLPAALTGDAEIEARFRREAEVAARLTDPHVIPIHDFGELHGRLFLDMRLVSGVDLAKTLQAEGALQPQRAVSILAQVAGALDAAHASGLVHRDVKPSNILLTSTRPGADDFVYLIDFGIAAGAMVSTRLTAMGQTVGTPAYMAPERFVEGRDSDPRVDVYALGCVLYEMLTGTVAYDGTSFPNLMYQHLNAPPPQPSRFAGLPSGWDRVIAKALAKDPNERFAAAGDLADAARSALDADRPRETASTKRGVSPVSTASAPQSAVPTRFGPPPQPPGPSRAPGPEPFGPTDASSVAGSAPPSRHLGRLVSALIALVVNLFWLLTSIGGSGSAYSQCGVATSGCVGGTFGVLAALAALAGVVTAALAITRRRRHDRRQLVRSWLFFGTSFVLLIVTLALDAAATS